jgi:hypothetical protein
MHGPRKVFGSFQLALNERLVDDHLGSHICQLRLLPGFDLPSHRLEVALHPVNANRDAVDQRERLRVLSKCRSKRASDLKRD